VLNDYAVKLDSGSSLISYLNNWLIYLSLVILTSFILESAYGKYIEVTNTGLYKISKLTK